MQDANRALLIGQGHDHLAEDDDEKDQAAEAELNKPNEHHAEEGGDGENSQVISEQNQKTEKDTLGQLSMLVKTRMESRQSSVNYNALLPLVKCHKPSFARRSNRRIRLF